MDAFARRILIRDARSGQFSRSVGAGTVHRIPLGGSLPAAHHYGPVTCEVKLLRESRGS